MVICGNLIKWSIRFKTRGTEADYFHKAGKKMTRREWCWQNWAWQHGKVKAIRSIKSQSIQMQWTFSVLLMSSMGICVWERETSFLYVCITVVIVSVGYFGSRVWCRRFHPSPGLLCRMFWVLSCCLLYVGPSLCPSSSLLFPQSPLSSLFLFWFSSYY